MGGLLPIHASAHAAELDRLTALVHVLMAAVFVGWAIYFAYVLVRFRASRTPAAQTASPRARGLTAAEIAFVVVELVLLAGFALPAWATRARIPDDDRQSVVVRVVAEQFAWNVHYPGPDGIFGATAASLVAPGNPLGLNRRSPGGADDVTTINRLALPAGRTAIVQLSAKDVIHSFGIPAMRVKQDAIPGMVAPVWFVPTLEGEFEIACSQLCGSGHYRMRGVVEVMQAAAFEQWVRTQ
jgi:cytochrome c oxidase subunit 2